MATSNPAFESMMLLRMLSLTLKLLFSSYDHTLSNKLWFLTKWSVISLFLSMKIIVSIRIIISFFAIMLASFEQSLDIKNYN